MVIVLWYENIKAVTSYQFKEYHEWMKFKKKGT